MRPRNAPQDRELTAEDMAFLEEELLDTDLASAVAGRYLEHPDVLKAVAQQPTAPVWGMCIAKIIIEVRTKFMEKGMELSDRIWTQKDGVAAELSSKASEISANEMGAEVDPEEVYQETVKTLSQYEG